MKFYIDSLHLWLSNGQTRSLTFLPNKVNIITGGSHTGKTAILDIVDYCLFASEHSISESIINENVHWYGLRIRVNDKLYTLARRSPVGTNVSPEYFFSAVGDVPSVPTPNIQEGSLKKLLSADFGIDQDVKIPFGGDVLRAGSRISLRYFLLFNTISQNIIQHSDQFFDKQNKARYREALPRIFDIAVGIDTVENILKREKQAELERRLNRLEKLSAKTQEKREEFHSQLTDTLTQAKAYGLVPEGLDDGASLDALQRMVAEQQGPSDANVATRHDEISSELYQISRKIRGLKRFTLEYVSHKANLSTTADSLKPVDYLLANYEETVRTSVFEDIVRNLSDGLSQIKSATARMTPLDSNVAELVKSLEADRQRLQGELESLPSEAESFETNKEKYIFVGETKAKLELFTNTEKGEITDYSSEIATLKNQIADLTVPPANERQEQFTKVLDETIQDYIALTQVALGNYGEYRSAFSYSEKKPHLRKPRSSLVENVGSSSNHMFLHLFMFLGLHDVIMRNEGIHVAPFLIIDQFSRPYWGDDGVQQEINQSDATKVKLALKLLDQFITTATDMGKEFQIILFEHINPPYWEGLKNVHLVETFRDGNALILGVTGE
ncbi:DUF3732 domain-containing protein [Agrobacterium tumefaciens]|uniref:DUF3732 domain-containing protein n=1 Tax=Agrobacterium tumefaciens TaxID=358 RepID=UPI0021CE857C|nr:DUF3732 domain-containing protein [Agrobacterium tumefaciens]UXS45889.1 DUF3732 domain-containing protein [Agrobacterium tumefaciens]